MSQLVNSGSKLTMEAGWGSGQCPLPRESSCQDILTTGEESRLLGAFSPGIQDVRQLEDGQRNIQRRRCEGKCRVVEYPTKIDGPDARSAASVQDVTVRLVR